MRWRAVSIAPVGGIRHLSRGPTPSTPGSSPKRLAGRVRECLPDLPDTQRQVVLLRDVEGMDAAEVCDLLGVSPGNQRVLLHRARARLRSLLDTEMQGS